MPAIRWYFSAAGACLAGIAGSVRAQDAAAPSAETPPPAAAPEVKEEPSWLKGWKGGFELGLNGSEGNTTRFNFRAGANANRVTELYDTKFTLTYSYAREESNDTENRFVAEGRNDWLIKDSAWRYFIKTTFEYDDFQDWDFRWTAHGGVGYEFVKTEKTTLLGRAGLGFSRKFGGADEDWRFEGLLGADFAHQLTERQKVTASVDVYPDLSDIGRYRAEAKAAWEVLVDPESSMTLKLGIADRYDSNPGDGFKKNDLDYFAVLVWSF
jgi:putative salt-induced outer membrane protein YdiY